MRESQGDPVRAVVVDDSPTVRDLLVAILQSAGGIQVVGTAANGEDAVRLTKRLKPDVVTMDILMPKMDGLEATQQIMREIPTPIVIVTGTLMRHEMDLTFDSLRAGALAVVHTPGLADVETCEKVIQAVRLMAHVPVVRRWEKGKGDRQRGSTAQPEKSASPCLSNKLTEHKIEIIGIAASTGGPGTLAKILKPLPADFPLPILIVQHVTNGFGSGLAEWLNRETKIHVRLANHGDIPRAGNVLVASDDYHLQLNTRREVELHHEAPYRGFRPSANYLFSSLAQQYGPGAMGVILTGMGDDGVDGLEQLYKSGGLTLAQDEASCVVYGMPREAVARNVVDQVLTLTQISQTFEQVAQSNHRAKETSING